jgi:hypothetical protein
MKFELHGNWPITGGILVPAGTVLSGPAPTYNGSPVPLPLPLDAWVMDDEAAGQMRVWYGHEWHRVQFGPAVTKTKRS